MISLLIYILVMCIVFALFYWILSMVPLPPPVKQIVTVVIAVIFVIFLIYLILPLAGGAPALRPLR
jgi:hypothetical protein